MEQRIHFLDENYRKRKAKTTLLNTDLIMLKTLLKTDTDTIKSFLTYSIQKFNEEKYKLQMFLTPLSKVNSDVELCKSHISNIKYQYFPNWPQPKCAISQSAISQVCPSHIAWFSACSSRGARPPIPS